ncbi:MAG: BMP family ABC transporter substrate-binding protein [Clostridiales bacterium]|nr:BMP family ABC transporter substrate-binding protein [Clostridiales bacterium]
MKSDYKAAKKKAEKAVRDAVREGRSPYLPVLDALEEIKHATVTRSIGLLDLPVNRIKGNKEQGRNSAFAANFMPLLDENTEFALKWSDLYDSYKQQGIRDAIKVYEYMHQFYVQEGNKRVSVSKFGGTDYMLADVTRVIPDKSDDPEVIAYYEYMDFFKVTHNHLIVFTQPGEYKRLAELVGQDLKNPWPEDLCKDLKSAYFRFARMLKKEFKIEDMYMVGNAFLVYLSIFPLATFSEDSDDQILKNVRLARHEILTAGTLDSVTFLDQAAAGEQKNSIITNFFTKPRKYTEDAPLKVGFIYDKGVDDSRWIDSHEAGRLYIDVMVGKNVSTAVYYTGDDGIKPTLEKCIADGCELVFSVCPEHYKEVLKAAVKHPEVKFASCSAGQTNPSVRCYQGKLYEPSFLIGVLAAQTQLLEYGNTEDRKIGYLARGTDAINRINLNAFAIGVAMADPECKISLKAAGRDEDYRQQWESEGVKVYSDMEYSPTSNTGLRPGVYKIKDGKDIYVGASYYNWGKYYLQIVSSVLNGMWNINEIIDKHIAANYWFGLATGVVDIRVPDINKQTLKMLDFFKDAVISGTDPFSGKLKDNEGNERTFTGKITPGDVLTIDWLNENIEGSL